MKRIQTENVHTLITTAKETFRRKIPPDLREAESTTLAGLGLSLIALVVLGIGVLSGRSDLPTGLLVITALVCFLASAVLIALGGGRGIPADCVSVLNRGSQISMARICSDLGCDGNAHFCAHQENGSAPEVRFSDMNSAVTDSNIWQFNPARSVGTAPNEQITDRSGDEQQSFARILKNELVPDIDASRGTTPVFQVNGPVQGLFSIPAGAALLLWLQKNHGLQIAGMIQHSKEEEGISGSHIGEVNGKLDTAVFSDLLTNIYSEILGCAEQVTVSQEGDGALVIQTIGYTLLNGCQIVAAESKNVCSMVPCAFCSLQGCMLSAVTDQVWTLSHVRLLPEKRSMMAVWECVE